VKRRKNGNNQKSKIQDTTLERPITLEQGLRDGMATCGLHCCRMKIFYQGSIGDFVATGLYAATGLFTVIGVLDARDYCECVYLERGIFIESYIQEEFGSGVFEVGLYDENSSEIGRYRYYISGAPEYIHTPKASGHKDSESEDPIVKLFMMLFRERFLEEDDYFLEEDDC